MKRILCILLFITVFFACKKENAGDCFKGVGSQTSEIRELAPFDKLMIEKNPDVVIIPDTTEFVEVFAGENLIDLITTEVSNDGWLTISNHNKCNWVRKFDTPIRVEVHTKNLVHVYFKGSGSVTCTDTLRSDNFRLEAYDGSGDVDLVVRNGWSLVAQHTGNADLKLRGIVPYNTMYSGGNGFIDCRGLITPNAYVRHRGTGNFYVYASDYLEANIELIGDIYYYGNPDTVDQNITGSGKLIKQ